MRGSTEARRRRIRSILERSNVSSQAELQDALAVEGFEVTQATVSRDLDAVGAVRTRRNGSTVYRIGNEDVTAERSALFQAVDEFVESVATSGNIVILKVPPGAAQFVASRIDAAAVDGVLGTIAGDDTIMVVADEPVGADEVCKRLQGTESS
jgi:transcriptional regulator of arginine metabolism